ncbi:MAG: hypothetical protein IPP69_17505 [Flavobacteriales bacterium]|nr:hypothetical protein [Flavobacteriales bacterium]
MPNPTTFSDNQRFNLFKNDLGDQTSQNISFEKHFTEKNGDWTEIKEALVKDDAFDEGIIAKLSFTNDVANLTNDNAELTKYFQNNVKTNSTRDIAIHFTAEVANNPEINTILGDKNGAHAIAALEQKLFITEPSASLSRILTEDIKTFPLRDIAEQVSNILMDHPEFDIRTTSVNHLIAQAGFQDQFKDVGKDWKRKTCCAGISGF